HYNGIITNNFLLEGQYSRRTFAFVNSGSTFTDLVNGTLLLDRSNGNTRFNSPTFCGVCAPETRDNGEYILKGNYYLNTRSLGNHNFVAGVDNFKEKRFAEHHQSGSDYRLYVTTAFIASLLRTTSTSLGSSARTSAIRINPPAPPVRSTTATKDRSSTRTTMGRRPRCPMRLRRRSPGLRASAAEWSTARSTPASARARCSVRAGRAAFLALWRSTTPG